MSLNERTWKRIKGLVADPANAEGGDVFLERLLRNLAIWRSLILANTIISIYGARVMSGPFEGMQYVAEATEGALLPRLVGSYESELHPHIAALIGEGLDQIVDIGCAEGYYAVGLARLAPQITVHAHDLDPHACEACVALAALNEVADRVRVGGLFAGEDFARFENTRTLVFMDIEGGEAELLDPERWPALRSLKVLVETHPAPNFRLTDEITARFASSHEVIRVEQGPKTTPLPPWFRNRGHLDQLLASWEWRSRTTPWLVMRPKGASAWSA